MLITRKSILLPENVVREDLAVVITAKKGSGKHGLPYITKRELP